MPKIPSSKSALIREWIKNSPWFTTDGKVIFCQVCSKEVSTDKPVTTVDVERSFSGYKLVLTDKRMQFEPKNLEMVLVVYCEANYGCK